MVCHYHGELPPGLNDSDSLSDYHGTHGFDRILGVNVIGTKTAVILVIIGTLYDRVDMFVDFAIAYALLNFVGAIVVSATSIEQFLCMKWKSPNLEGEGVQGHD